MLLDTVSYSIWRYFVEIAKSDVEQTLSAVRVWEE